MTGAVPSLLTALKLEEVPGNPDRFVGGSHWMPHGRIYGGQLVGQAAAAAARTVPGDRPAHSLHGYFLRPGDNSKSVEYAVERLQDGRSISHRRVQAYQDGNVIWSSIISFQVDEPGASHQVPAPDVPGPEELARTPMFGDPASLPAEDEAFEVRRLEGDDAEARLGGKDMGRFAVWIRGTGELPTTPSFHQATIAYASDFGLLMSIFRAQGTGMRVPGTKVTSLDHALWWHRPVRTDEWLLLVMESPQSGSSRGLTQGRFYTRDGLLVATVVQEGMVRAPAPLF